MMKQSVWFCRVAYDWFLWPTTIPKLNVFCFLQINIWNIIDKSCLACFCSPNFAVFMVLGDEEQPLLPPDITFDIFITVEKVNWPNIIVQYWVIVGGLMVLI